MDDEEKIRAFTRRMYEEKSTRDLRIMLSEVKRKIALGVTGPDNGSNPKANVRKAIYEMALIQRGEKL
jgi:hypothetical protein